MERRDAQRDSIRSLAGYEDEDPWNVRDTPREHVMLGKRAADTDNDSVEGNLRKKNWRLPQELDSNGDPLDEDYAATQDVNGIPEPVQFWVRPGRGVVVQYVEKDDEVDDVVAEEPGDNHHRIINLVREYSAPQAIEPVVGTTEVSIISNMLLKEARKGRTDLVEAVIKLRGLPHTEWMDRRIDIAPTAIIKSLVSMTCTMSIRLLGHLVMGQLPRAIVTEEAIDNEIRGLMSDAQPAIYANYIVDDRGFGPSPNEWANVITGLYRYMEDDNYSIIIDRVYNPLNAVNGAKKYLSTKKSLEENLPMCRDRTIVLRQFITALEERIRNTPYPDQQMIRPLSEVGYSRHPLSRLRAHARQRSSNFLMGICMAVLEEEVPYTEFRLSQHVIMQIYDQKSAALGEVFMTALLQAHTVNAGGFSHAAAGLSISSVKRVSEKEWQPLQLSIAEDDKYMRRMSAEAWRLNKGTKETGNQPDLAAELAGEREKRDAMWKEIERIAPEIQRLANAEMDLVRRVRDAFL
ncbi:hypothetical protein V491_00244 [Pseudogymnoascus sp. VKM F-3775]|nr:hypothetical protein V491_00244 [Pseudogymnoascus sp. VKM F-3775]